jgi:GNAT superfamily N-acetyltransferase
VATTGRRSLLWEALRDAIVSHQCATAEGRVWEARVEAVRFLRRRGFVAAQHLPGLRLVLADADLAELGPLRDWAAAEGFLFTTLCQEQASAPDWSAKLQDLLNAVWPDMPQTTPGPYDPAATRAAPQAPVFRTVEALACLTIWPEAFFLAKRGAQYVGWSSLARRGGDPGAVSVGDTGVRRTFRRRGLATALKAEAIAFAKRRGYRVILTKTANPAMLAVNEAVGFRREQGVWDRRAPGVSRDD